jgi:hypothetical protein
LRSAAHMRADISCVGPHDIVLHINTKRKGSMKIVVLLSAGALACVLASTGPPPSEAIVLRGDITADAVVSPTHRFEDVQLALISSAPPQERVDISAQMQDVFAVLMSPMEGRSPIGEQLATCGLLYGLQYMYCVNHHSVLQNGRGEESFGTYLA